MQSISFPRSPANFQTLPTELKDKVIQEVVTDALAPLSATSLGVQQSSSPATRLSAETIKRQSNKLNSLMMVNKDFMKLMLSYLRRHPDPKILHPLSWVALNSILRERNADTFNNMIRAFLEDCTYLDLSHRSVAPFMSGERVALIVNQLATIPAKHLQTAVLHFKEKKEWDDAKDKFAQIHQVNPEVLIPVSFPDNPGELSWPPSDLSTVLRGRENVKGVKVTQVSRGDVEDSAQFFTFLLSGSSVNELAL